MCCEECEGEDDATRHSASFGMANCNGWFGTVKEDGWLAAYIPPFAVRLQRMGHPSYFGWIRESGSRLRANAHISKSRYGAPNFVASIQKWATRPEGHLADAIGVQHAFVIPAVCYIYIALFGYLGGRRAEREVGLAA